MNVLLVVFDTARADALEPYGAAAGASPAVADVARRGRAVEGVHSTACWTLPSHASMLSGALPRALGLTQAPGGTAYGSRPVIEGLRDRWLPEVLRRHGWRTQAVSCNVWISALGGWDTGFDDFTTIDSGREARLGRPGRRERLAWVVESARARSDDGAAEAGRVLREQIAAWSGQPTFWFVNLIECHSPYLPPHHHSALGPIGRARTAAEARRHLTLEAVSRVCLSAFDVPGDALERMKTQYAASVCYLDDWLAGVLEALDARGALDETLVIVTSDHGENFGEGGLLAHAWSLDERLCRVPFACCGPGADGAALRSLAEVPAFVSDVAGVRDHPWRNGLPPVPVAQFDPPGDGPDDPRIIAAAERWGLGEAARARMFEPLTSATDGGRKLVVRGSREELYDLAADPLEERPLEPREHDVAALREALAHPAVTALAARPAAAPAAADPDEVARLEEQMKLLGYM